MVITISSANITKFVVVYPPFKRAFQESPRAAIEGTVVDNEKTCAGLGRISSYSVPVGRLS